MTTLDELKKAARKAAFERRKLARSMDTGASAGLLSSVLAGNRAVPLAGYFPIRTEIDPTPAMAEAAAHGVVGVPVITGEAQPLLFSKWEPDCAMKDGPFGARIPLIDDYFEPEVLIVPLVAFDRAGGRLGYGGGFYDRTLEKLRAKRATLAIGFAYSLQEAENLPLEPTDQQLDMIVTEQDIIEIQSQR
jgi:5-formyltetrahydrofolate cyclo-ligase